MPRATVTSKGQVTIPKEVRDALRLGTGDRVAFLVRSDGVAELRPQTIDLGELYGMLRHRGKPVSVEEMNEAVAAAAAASHRKSTRR